MFAFCRFCILSHLHFVTFTFSNCSFCRVCILSHLHFRILHFIMFAFYIDCILFCLHFILFAFCHIYILEFCILSVLHFCKNQNWKRKFENQKIKDIKMKGITKFIEVIKEKLLSTHWLSSIQGKSTYQKDNSKT